MSTALSEELLKAVSIARLPSTPDEQVVFRTDSDAESIIILCGDNVYYANKGYYGDWLVHDLRVRDNCKAYLVEPAIIARAEGDAAFDEMLKALRVDVKEVDERARSKGGNRNRIELVEYKYVEAGYRIKKKTNEYTILELIPRDNPAKLKARALRMCWYFPGSRRHPMYHEAWKLVEMWRLELPAARYMYVTGDRSAWMWLKLVVDAPQFYSASPPATAVETPPRQADSLEEALKELENALRGIASTEAPQGSSRGALEHEAQRPDADKEQPEKGGREEEQEAVAQQPGGMVEVRLLLFNLPSEYKRSKAKVEVDERSGAVTEVRMIDSNLTAIRALRTKFYDYLHQIAYKLHDVWALYSDVKPEELDELVKIAGEIEDVAKAAGIDARAELVVVPAYIPRDYLSSYLNRHIEAVRKKLEEAKSERVRRELAQALERLEQELSALARRIG